MQVKNRQSNKQQQTNANYTAWSKLAVAQHWALKSWHANRRLACALTLLPASLLMSGCAGPRIKPCVQPELISKPALQYPLPPVSYSLTAAERIESWRLRLTSISSTSSSSLTVPEGK